MKKRISLFYIIYFSLILLFAVSLTVFLIWLNSWVSDYNKTLPETVSENFFDSTFKSLDTDKIISMSETRTSEFETEKELKEYLEERFKEPLSYTSVSTNDENVKKYIVKSGEDKVASFELTREENEDWTPAKIILHAATGECVSVKILSNSTLFINGKEVSSDYIVSTEPHQNAEYLPEGINALTWTLYTVEGLFGEAEIKVLDRNGNSPALIKTGNSFEENIIWDNEEELANRLLEAARQYAMCMQNDAKKSTLDPYFEKGTDLYKRIQSVQTSFVWDHNGYEFEDEKVSEFYRYDENTVSARISFVHVLKMYGREDYRNFTDITFFARAENGEYMIFACYNN